MFQLFKENVERYLYPSLIHMQGQCSIYSLEQMSVKMGCYINYECGIKRAE